MPRSNRITEQTAARTEQSAAAGEELTSQSGTDKAGKKLATQTLETEIRFASAKARQEFSEELVNTVARLAMKYHDQKAEGGRSFRYLLGGYPVITRHEAVDEASVRMG